MGNFIFCAVTRKKRERQEQETWVQKSELYVKHLCIIEKVPDLKFRYDLDVLLTKRSFETCLSRSLVTLF